MCMVLRVADGGQQCCSVVHTADQAVFGRGRHRTYYIIDKVIALSSVVELPTPIEQLATEYMTDTRPHVVEVGCG